MTYQAAENRYEKKDWFRRCGRTGLMLPAVTLGCWHNFGEASSALGGRLSEPEFHENCRRMLFSAFDQGITHFDLANNYGPPPGRAEERVGRILREDFGGRGGYRDELIISTKAGYTMWPGPYGDWGSRKYLLASLDASLKRLGLEYVDLFYHHRVDPNTPLEETMGALEQAVKSGKALYAGISNYRGGMTAQAVGVCEREKFARPIINQLRYNLLERWAETDLLPVTERAGMGVICFSPLAQGQLTDRYLEGIPEDSRAASASPFLKESQITQEKLGKVRRLNAVAKKRGQTLAQMALAWVLRWPGVTSVLIGASRPEQIAENVAAATGAAFSAEELETIEGILAGK
jgi:L-glyceraldehyde 3-phosphate reductase